MPKYAHPDVLTNGPNYIKTNCNKVVAIFAYTAGDSYATVMTAGNIIGEADMASSDFTLGSAGSNITLTTAAGKTDAAANNSGDPTHFAFVDTVNSKVLWVTTESSGLSAVAGIPMIFPALVYTSIQPT